MAQVNIHEAKTHLSRLVEQAAKGKEIVIAKSGKPVARLVALAPVARKKRKPGALKGRIRLMPGWDAPMSRDELAEFYEGRVRP